MHIGREENGIFAALRKQGEYVDEIDDLEGEHRWFDATIADLDPDSTDFLRVLDTLFEALGDHIEREDLGIFPVSVVTLGSDGWDIVAQAHADQPSFLDGTDTPALPGAAAEPRSSPSPTPTPTPTPTPEQHRRYPGRGARMSPRGRPRAGR